MAQELIFTSAPRGLKPGTSGVCTVVASNSMPPLLMQRLEAISGYRLPCDGREPIPSLSHTTIDMSGLRRHVVSRVADLGADHAGKLNRIAHHMVLHGQELGLAGPSWLVQQQVFATSWDGRTEFREGEAWLPEGPPQPARVCATWKTVTGDAGWAGVVAQHAISDPAQPVWLIFRRSTPVLSLLDELFAIVPARDRWKITFCTNFTQPLPGAECAIRFCLAGTDAAHAARHAAEHATDAAHGGGLFLDLAAVGHLNESGGLITIARTGKHGDASALQQHAVPVALEPVKRGRTVVPMTTSSKPTRIDPRATQASMPALDADASVDGGVRVVVKHQIGVWLVMALAFFWAGIATVKWIGNGPEISAPAVVDELDATVARDASERASEAELRAAVAAKQQADAELVVAELKNELAGARADVARLESEALASRAALARSGAAERVASGGAGNASPAAGATAPTPEPKGTTVTTNGESPTGAGAGTTPQPPPTVVAETPAIAMLARPAIDAPASELGSIQGNAAAFVWPSVAQVPFVWSGDQLTSPSGTPLASLKVVDGVGVWTWEDGARDGDTRAQILDACTAGTLMVDGDPAGRGIEPRRVLASIPWRSLASKKVDLRTELKLPWLGGVTVRDGDVLRDVPPGGAVDVSVVDELGARGVLHLTLTRRGDKVSLSFTPDLALDQDALRKRVTAAEARRAFITLVEEQDVAQRNAGAKGAKQAGSREGRDAYDQYLREHYDIAEKIGVFRTQGLDDLAEQLRKDSTAADAEKTASDLALSRSDVLRAKWPDQRIGVAPAQGGVFAVVHVEATP